MRGSLTVPSLISFLFPRQSKNENENTLKREAERKRTRVRLLFWPCHQINGNVEEGEKKMLTSIGHSELWSKSKARVAKRYALLFGPLTLIISTFI